MSLVIFTLIFETLLPCAKNLKDLQFFKNLTIPNKVDTSLEILEVRPEDAGTYFCNVETYGEPLDQAHTLDVLVPPSVQVEASFIICHFDYLNSRESIEIQ